MDERDKLINDLRRAVAGLQEVWIDGSIDPEEKDTYLILWAPKNEKGLICHGGPFYAFITFYPKAGWDYTDEMNQLENSGYDIQVLYWRALEPATELLDTLEGF